VEPTILSQNRLLRLWEKCAGARLPDRARAILRAAYPHRGAAEWEARTIGEWNSALLRFRSAQFGPVLQIFDRCPSCNGSIEFEAAIDRILPAEDPPAAEHALSTGDWTIRYRPLTGADWSRAFRREEDAPEEAAKRLLGAALLCVREGATEAAPERLPDQAWEELADALVEADTASEIIFKVRCPSCGEEWDAPLEPAEFLWREINATCRRLLRQIHALATAYGWSEAAILRMSRERRATYLQLVEETNATPFGPAE
jgi:hypothetical protein